MKKKIKRAIFIVFICAVVVLVGLVLKFGYFEKLEGYLFAAAQEFTDATCSDATSCDATSSDATSCDATSSNATSCNATSSNATSCDATSSNATSCNATSSDASNNGITVINQVPESNEQLVEIPKEIVENKKEDIVVNNSDITTTQLKKIKNSSENVIITLDSSSVISQDIFDAIKGTERQLTIKSGDNELIINGKDITNPKDIDAAITIKTIDQDEELKATAEKGIIVDIAENGELPGKFTVRIKENSEINDSLDINNILVYHYNDASKELIQLPYKASYTDGYIVFEIDHASKYVLVSDQFKEAAGAVIETDNEVTFLESHLMYVIVIVLSIIAVAFVVAILILDKVTKGKAAMKK